MIRVFEVFCKLNFIKISALDFFYQSMAELKICNHKCPFCGAECPDWKRHDSYERDLIYFKKGTTVIDEIIIIRYKCSSCKHPHAILPECIIPYQSYCLLFILRVLRDYYTKVLTVQGICDKYGISVSTLYAWKALYHIHKKIWLGLLDNAVTSSLQFLETIFNERLYILKDFFHIAGLSFLQGSLKKAHWNME